MAIVTPARTDVPQHMKALASANFVRFSRAALKAAISRNEYKVTSVVMNPAYSAKSMSIGELLMSQHRWGVQRVNRFLAELQISSSKRVGALTTRQRRLIVDKLATVRASRPIPPKESIDMVPDRSLTQRRSALDKANIVRGRRASLKRDLTHGRATLSQYLTNPPEWLETAKIRDMLLALPKFGKVKTDRTLSSVRMSESKTIGGISTRQCQELLRVLKGR